MLLQTLSQALLPGEHLTFTLTRAGDQLTLQVSPTLAAPVENTDDPTAGIRAALALPLRITTPADTDEAVLLGQLRQYAEARQGLAGRLSALDALKEAGKAADRLAQGKATGKTPATEAAPPSETAPAPTAPAPAPVLVEDPDDLFA